MSAVVIQESGMLFGPFPETDCLDLERSNLFRRLGEGIKTAEMAVVRPAKAGLALWIIEAKSSSPRPGAGEQQERFSSFIQDIREKLANALALIFAAAVGRHGEAEAILPSGIAALQLADLQIRLVLVVNGHEPEWCPPLQDALRQALRPVVKTYALGPNAVTVIDDRKAQALGLVSG
jgi:hypothetical protein